MRKKRFISANSEDDFSLQRAKEMLIELRERVAWLEGEVFSITSHQFFPAPPKRMGRRPKIETQVLLNRRNRLTTWLEQNWPNLSIALRRARNSSQALAGLIAAKEGVPGALQPPFYHQLERHEAALWQFLRSGRYHGNPRNLAAAMAGLPELSWKRSFDICSKHPHKGGLALQAYWDYMRRNFPDRLRELAEVRTPEQVKMILARSRTNDPIYLHLKEHPDEALEWLKAGKPSLLGL
jgi:hypothetical protein